MRHRSMTTIALLAALALAGCATDGENQNYKVLEEDRDRPFEAPDTGFDPDARAMPAPLFRITSAGTEPSRPDGAGMVITASQDGALDEALEPEPAPGVQSNGDGLKSRPGGEAELLGDPTEQGVKGAEPPEAGTILDRRDWPRIVVAPADGTTIHNPIYWRDCPLDDTHAHVLVPESAEARLNAALANPDAGNWNATNAAGFGVQPLKFAADIVLLPWYVIQDHPWKEVTTPPSE